MESGGHQAAGTETGHVFFTKPSSEKENILSEDNEVKPEETNNSFNMLEAIRNGHVTVTVTEAYTDKAPKKTDEELK